MKRGNQYNKAIHILQELKKDFPNETLGQHISTALSEYSDVWSLSDKEFVFALEKYQVEKDTQYTGDAYVEKIYNDGLNISDPNFFTLDTEDEEDF